MDFGIAGKVAFVSGGSKGVGLATSLQLAREGCRVVVAARGQQAIDETVEAIRKEGGTAIGVSADLYNQADVKRAVEVATKAFGSPDIAISNVHGPGHGNFFDLTAADFAQAFNELALSVVYLAQAVLPHMQKQKWGRLINIGSYSAKEPPPELKHLLATCVRASVVTLNKSLANEFGSYGITVNTIGTGFIDSGERLHTYMQTVAKEQGITEEALLASLMSNIPAGRIGTTEEAAALIAFLCSEGAAYITGNIIPVDGGYHRAAW